MKYVKLTKNRKKELQFRLATCNKKLDFFHKKLSEKISKTKYFTEIFNFHRKNPCEDFNKFGILVSVQDIKQIIYCKEIELELIESLYGMVCKIVSEYNNNEKDDLFGEAYKSILSSIPYYTDSNISFTTYFYRCIKNQINSYFNRKYNKMKLLNQEQSQIAIVGNYKVCFGARRNNLELVVKNKEQQKIDFEKINLEKFSELEKAVYEGVLDGKNKKINLYAKDLINPKTNKPYTRAAISSAWKRVRGKIKNMAA